MAIALNRQQICPLCAKPLHLAKSLVTVQTAEVTSDAHVSCYIPHLESYILRGCPGSISQEKAQTQVSQLYEVMRFALDPSQSEGSRI